MTSLAQLDHIGRSSPSIVLVANSDTISNADALTSCPQSSSKLLDCSSDLKTSQPPPHKMPAARTPVRFSLCLSLLLGKRAAKQLRSASRKRRSSYPPGKFRFPTPWGRSLKRNPIGLTQISRTTPQSKPCEGFSRLLLTGSRVGSHHSLQTKKGAG